MVLTPGVFLYVLAIPRRFGAQSRLCHGAEVHLDERFGLTRLAVDVELHLQQRVGTE